MRITVERQPIRVSPDAKRVIARFFFSGEQRAKEVIGRVMSLDEDQVFALVSPLLQEFSKRHRNITRILYKHCNRVQQIAESMGIDFEEVKPFRKLLIGAYFTHEYSIESAAFFNPSIVEDPDQTELDAGQKRVIISFRAVGEGHISSIVFRRAVIDQGNRIQVLPVGNYVDEASVVRSTTYEKRLFFEKIVTARIDNDVVKELEEKMTDKFDYTTLRSIILEMQRKQTDDFKRTEYEKILWLSESYNELTFSLDTDISDRVIFPVSELERKGIEDARFVKFVDNDGTVIYYATYTAFDGALIIPKLLQTSDFCTFKIRPLHGSGALNKNLALFPRRINGNYVMLSRIDGCNNYIMYSRNINLWENPMKLQEPLHPWEFTQIGNCGSPIETEHGWLVITHGVGPMRRYCLGATLLKIDDPSVEIGRLKEPLLAPNQDEREGYVPNVVYSCGGIINKGKLILPYGLSDYSSSFAVIDLKELLDKVITDSQ
ncbi:glycoside hydrolase family 130 protein [Mucilaginibacter sp. HMF5004]|uniref:glycoside hydrolase family 130 protein n=1 Tax=Mucilaginibacter rivuli TaxID=2857527 RepID=UPI001C5FCB32|nr:glycoside hydrolase family 130 protein [Mucilaginibacter rivuli]MBW4889385.1 glycoside hydrolase family 130 protein [Mucilaginibacter rivuli]